MGWTLNGISISSRVTYWEIRRCALHFASPSSSPGPHRDASKHWRASELERRRRKTKNEERKRTKQMYCPVNLIRNSFVSQIIDFISHSIGGHMIEIYCLLRLNVIEEL